MNNMLEWVRAWGSPNIQSGAIDVVAIKRSDGSINCSPFHVKLGKVSKQGENRIVRLKVNGNEVPLRMKLGRAGEAFFIERRKVPSSSFSISERNVEFTEPSPDLDVQKETPYLPMSPVTDDILTPKEIEIESPTKTVYPFPEIISNNLNSMAEGAERKQLLEKTNTRRCRSYSDGSFKPPLKSTSAKSSFPHQNMQIYIDNFNNQISMELIKKNDSQDLFKNLQQTNNNINISKPEHKNQRFRSVSDMSEFAFNGFPSKISADQRVPETEISKENNLSSSSHVKPSVSVEDKYKQTAVGFKDSIPPPNPWIWRWGYLPVKSKSKSSSALSSLAMDPQQTSLADSKRRHHFDNIIESEYRIEPENILCSSALKQQALTTDQHKDHPPIELNSVNSVKSEKIEKSDVQNQAQPTSTASNNLSFYSFELGKFASSFLPFPYSQPTAKIDTVLSKESHLTENISGQIEQSLNEPIIPAVTNLDQLANESIFIADEKNQHSLAMTNVDFRREDREYFNEETVLESSDLSLPIPAIANDPVVAVHPIQFMLSNCRAELENLLESPSVLSRTASAGYQLNQGLILQLLLERECDCHNIPIAGMKDKLGCEPLQTILETNILGKLLDEIIRFKSENLIVIINNLIFDFEAAVFIVEQLVSENSNQNTDNAEDNTQFGNNELHISDELLDSARQYLTANKAMDDGTESLRNLPWWLGKDISILLVENKEILLKPEKLQTEISSVSTSRVTRSQSSPLLMIKPGSEHIKANFGTKLFSMELNKKIITHRIESATSYDFLDCLEPSTARVENSTESFTDVKMNPYVSYQIESEDILEIHQTDSLQPLQKPSSFNRKKTTAVSSSEDLLNRSSEEDLFLTSLDLVGLEKQQPKSQSASMYHASTDLLDSTSATTNLDIVTTGNAVATEVPFLSIQPLINEESEAVTDNDNISIEQIELDEIAPGPAGGDFYESDTDSYVSFEDQEKSETTKYNADSGPLNKASSKRTDSKFRMSRLERYRYRKSLVPSQEQLEMLPLQLGANEISFELEGCAPLTAQLFMWPEDCKVIVTVVEGVITKPNKGSSGLGWVSFMAGSTSTSGNYHEGSIEFFSNLEKNGYKVLYMVQSMGSNLLSSQEYLQSVSITQSNLIPNRSTKKSLNSKEQRIHLPSGPVFKSPDSLIRAFGASRTDVFISAALRGFKSLFPSHCNPFHACFGSRECDMIVFSHPQFEFPPGRTFFVNEKGEIKTVRMSSIFSFKELNDLRNEVFPSIFDSSLRIEFLTKRAKTSSTESNEYLSVNETLIKGVEAERESSSLASTPSIQTNNGELSRISSSNKSETTLSRTSSVRRSVVADDTFNDFNYWKIQPAILDD